MRFLMAEAQRNVTATAVARAYRQLLRYYPARTDQTHRHFFSFASFSFGSSFCSHPVTISRLGKAFFNLLTPASVTFVCHRYRLFNLDSPANSSSPRSVISVP